MRANNDLFHFIFYDLTVIDAVFVEELEYSIKVLVVSICAERNFVFVIWLLGSFGNEFIEFIAHGLCPFTDGKSDEQFAFSFYAEVSVCIALFKV